MCGALDELLFQIEKLVFLPFETCSGVRALIVISKELTIFMHHKNRLGFTLDFNLETFAARVFDIDGFTDYVHNNV